ncbi:3-methyl-2-oxobutanoate hydroxymethyltransferase [Asaia astilbis]|uniref:3-methyl-2-oxobutanoate hydroxymethyltransferase n=1 Tax=Asaia astilbis TaxID=610244 RepID=UPI00046FF395|nr:3-methyl-2-oxobutanoate hydroxymethyltransferase [Asaia astilbis]
MSASTPIRTLTPASVLARKGQTPLVCLTAYTTPIARLADAACDIVLVGDSVGMVLHGLPSTLGVTMEMMILHGKAVMRGIQKALCVVDMPFGSYEESPAQAFRNASRLLAETGASAVKLEGGVQMKETIAFLVARGVPVMGHIGLTPQAVNVLGGYKVQGRNEDAQRVMEDARAVEEAGAFAIVLEKLPRSLGQDITECLAIPTIGIGAGPDCDGQILVIDDMLGLFADFKPKFVKRYATLADDAAKALAAYADDVRQRAFPDAEHSFGDKP